MPDFGLMGDSRRGQGAAMPGYAPVTIYDAPSIVAAQLLEGEASWRTISSTFLAPNRLTPEERSTLRDKLLGPDKRDRITETVVGLATDPMVWFMFLTSPVGGKALAEGASLFKLNKAYSGFVKRASGLMSHLLTPLEEFAEHNQNILSIADDIKVLGGRSHAIYKEGQDRLIQRLDEMLGRPGKWADARPLDVNNYRRGSEEYNLVRRVMNAAGVRTAGLDREVVEEVLTSPRNVLRRKPGEEAWSPMKLEAASDDYARRTYEEVLREMDEKAKASWDEMVKDRGAYARLAEEAEAQGVKPYVLWRKKTQGEVMLEALPVEARKKVLTPAMVHRHEVDKVFEEVGPALDEYVGATQKAMDDSLVEMLYKRDVWEGTGRFEVDDDKLFRLAGSFGRSMDVGGPLSLRYNGMSSDQGKELIHQLLGVDAADKLVKMAFEGRVPFLKEQLRKVAEMRRTNPHYFARVTYRPMQVLTETGMALPSNMGEVELKVLEQAPWAASRTLADRVAPLTEKELLVNADWLNDLSKDGWLTRGGRAHMTEGWATSQRNWADHNRATLGLVPDYDEMVHRSLRQMHVTTAMDTRVASLAALDEDAAYISHLSPELGGAKTKVWVGNADGLVQDVDVRMDLRGQPFERYVTPGALLDRFYARQHPSNVVRKERILTMLVPGAISGAGPEWVAAYNAHTRNKEMARWFADSALGRTIGKFGKGGKDFIEKLREFGDPLRASAPGQGLEGGVAKWFYLSHLGLNFSSITMNLLQPLLMAGTVGRLRDVLGAYKDAFIDMINYAKARAKLGARFISEAEKAALLKQTVPYAEHIGLGPAAELIDGYVASSGGKGIADKVSEIMMKGFEKSEWFNRLTAAHVLKRAYQAAGRSTDLGLGTFLADMKRFVLQTQFGASDLNTPMVFQKGMLANPLLRQFMTFPLRMATGAAYVFPRLGGETHLKGLMNYGVRAMGMSAMAYEVGKGMFHADLSRGLFVNAVTGVVGGDRFLDQNGSPIPLPPVLSIPVDFLRGVVDEDARLLTSAVSRTVPGGVALVRAMGMSPESPLPGFINPQQQYVDWANPSPEGLVPVFNRAGELTEFRDPVDVVARGLGVDMGQWNQPGSLAKYLVDQRDEFNGYRQEYLRLLASNDFGAAASVQREFQRRFKVPLTVTKDQVSAYFQQRTVGRVERVFDRLPPEMRSRYAEFVQMSGGAPQLEEGQLVQGLTARRRERFNQVQESRVRELVQRALEERSQVGGAASRSSGAFEGF